MACCSNIIIILSSLTPAPPERYLLPDLNFPDRRIQRQVLEALEKTGGGAARDTWLWAFCSCDDEIKLRVIPKLASGRGADVERLFTDMLCGWQRLDSDHREEVLEAVMMELGHYPSIRVFLRFNPAFGNVLYKMWFWRSADGGWPQHPEEPVGRLMEAGVYALAALSK